MMTRSSSRGTQLEKDDEGKYNRTRSSKRTIISSCGEWRPWADLPEELLDLIANKLSIIDFLAFGGVCKTWRSLYVAGKQYFMENQCPLAVLISAHAKRSCYFHNIFNGRTFKITLPNFAGKHRRGFIGGYLIVVDSGCQISLTNPFTGHEFHFPKRTPHPGCRFVVDRVLLASIKQSSHLVVAGIARLDQEVMIYQTKTSCWSFYSFAPVPWGVSDIAIFHGRIYFVSKHGRIGILSLRSMEVNKVKVENRPRPSSLYKLTVFEDQLFMVEFFPRRAFQMFRLDITEMRWEKLESLEDLALFTDDTICFLVRNPIRWGGRTNCLYEVEVGSNKCVLYDANGNFIESFEIEYPGEVNLVSACWFDPRTCYTIDEIEDA